MFLLRRLLIETPMNQSKHHTYPATSLFLLTFILFLSQFIFLGIYYLTEGATSLVAAYCNSKWLLNPFVASALTKLVALQLLICGIFIFTIWYATNAIGDIFSFNKNRRSVLALFLWISGVALVFFANDYYIAHSFFSKLVDDVIGRDASTMAFIKSIIIFTTIVYAVAFLLSLLNIMIVLRHKQFRFRDVTALLLTVAIIASFVPASVHHNKTTPASSQPNIFIIGFDALRPDFLHYFNQQKASTPAFDKFLSSAIVFTQAYTPLSRTSPSWASAFTGRYPIHHRNRDNLTPLDMQDLSQNLPVILKKAGYETMYASDDNLFNSTNNEVFDFDHLIGSDGNAADFIFSYLNDFPLTNLLSISSVGKFIFPYNAGNHASIHTFAPNTFLTAINQQLQQRSQKPLFLAVHFNTTAWPFFWLGDNQNNDEQTYRRYQHSVTKADEILARFLSVLETNGLLKNAIVILISDHGFALGEPGERPVQPRLYQGDKRNIKKLTYFAYREGVHALGKQSGIDTAWGYGSEVLSLTQHHQLFSMRFYGNQSFKPQQVRGFTSTLDLMPTLLALLKLKPEHKLDGISLLPYINKYDSQISKQRSLFLESAYAPDEINKSAINALRVLNESAQLFSLNPQSGKIYFTNTAVKIMITNKQRAILKDDWLLAFYPSSKRSRLIIDKDKHPTLELLTIPPYMILVNLKTGEWTTETKTSFVKASPFASLLSEIKRFYGAEMEWTYHI